MAVLTASNEASAGMVDCFALHDTDVQYHLNISAR